MNRALSFLMYAIGVFCFSCGDKAAESTSREQAPESVIVIDDSLDDVINSADSMKVSCNVMVYQDELYIRTSYDTAMTVKGVKELDQLFTQDFLDPKGSMTVKFVGELSDQRIAEFKNYVKSKGFAVMWIDSLRSSPKE